MTINKNNLLKIINGFRTGLNLLFFNIFKNSIKTVNITNDLSLQIEIHIKYILPIIYFLKNHSLCACKILTDMTCFDFLSNKFRYIVIYNLLNIKNGIRLFIKTKIKELNDNLLSISSLFYTANWSEREIYDFYGIYFFFNKDLRRILLDYGFQGYPLKKDFPLSGFLELFYDDTIKKITYDKISLCQEYRIFFYNKNHIVSNYK